MGPEGLEPSANRCWVNLSTACYSVHSVHPVSEKQAILSIESITSIVSMVFAPKLHPKSRKGDTNSNLTIEVTLTYISIPFW